MNNYVEFLPFPKKSIIWLGSIIVLLVSYGFYYVYGYPYLKNQFEQQLQSVKVVSNNENLNVQLKIPKYVSEFEIVPVYVEVKNSSEMIIENVQMVLVFNDDDNMLNKLFWLESYSEDSYFSSSIEFNNLLPKSSTYGRINLLVEKTLINDSSILPPSVYINGNATDYDRTLANIEFNPFLAFKYSFCKYILMPPWSNGILLLVVLISSYFVEKTNIWKLRRKKNSSIISIQQDRTIIQIWKEKLFQSVIAIISIGIIVAFIFFFVYCMFSCKIWLVLGVFFALLVALLLFIYLVKKEYVEIPIGNYTFYINELNIGDNGVTFMRQGEEFFVHYDPKLKKENKDLSDEKTSEEK